jgi:hypothetical protein
VDSWGYKRKFSVFFHRRIFGKNWPNAKKRNIAALIQTFVSWTGTLLYFTLILTLNLLYFTLLLLYSTFTLLYFTLLYSTLAHARIHGVITQKAPINIFTTTKISNLTAIQSQSTASLEYEI